jgi:hypothetical protein
MHLRSRHFNFSVGPNGAGNLGSFAVTGINSDTIADKNVALHKQELHQTTFVDELQVPHVVALFGARGSKICCY